MQENMVMLSLDQQVTVELLDYPEGKINNHITVYSLIIRFGFTVLDFLDKTVVMVSMD
jgi:hypothetical protein